MIAQWPAIVALKPGFQGSKELELDIMNFVGKKLSALAMPLEIEFVPGMPKTRSGRIMRRVLRAQEYGEEIIDISTPDSDLAEKGTGSNLSRHIHLLNSSQNDLSYSL